MKLERFKVGDRVRWAPSGERGTVTRSADDGFNVEWDDGEIGTYTHNQAECPGFFNKKPVQIVEAKKRKAARR